ncbi:hypothetical protein J6590_014013 [Homalodisca vitripennis]|nr:hypothetical protein J6590_014013 [Homalodisca vitripennis]
MWHGRGYGNWCWTISFKYCEAHAPVACTVGALVAMSTLRAELRDMLWLVDHLLDETPRDQSLVIAYALWREVRSSLEGLLIGIGESMESAASRNPYDIDPEEPEPSPPARHVRCCVCMDRLPTRVGSDVRGRGLAAILDHVTCSRPIRARGYPPGTSIHKKWGYIKDAFNREKRRISGTKSGSGATRKFQYVYYNMLSFLHSATLPTNTQKSLPGEDRDPDDDGEGTGDIDNPTTQTKVYHITVLAIKRKAPDDIDKQLLNVLKESSANERRQHEKEALEDQDRLFLMSLIKDFKNIPQQRKLSAKRQILLVIEQNQSRDLKNMGHCHEGSSQSLRFFGKKHSLFMVDMTRESTSKDLQ